MRKRFALLCLLLAVSTGCASSSGSPTPQGTPTSGGSSAPPQVGYVVGTTMHSVSCHQPGRMSYGF